MSNQMKFVVQELRPEVLAFALLMEQRLRDKDEDKGQSWKDVSDIDHLRVNATSKIFMIETAIDQGKNKAAAGYAVDLANYAMMIADVAGVLKLPEEQAEEWKRDDKRTYCTLLLVGGHDVNQGDIQYWADEDCRLAEEWAQCLHSHASDNEDVVVPRVPACVVAFLGR
jgi:hypothetical protein